MPGFRILVVTREQMPKWTLPTTPNKPTDTRSAAFEHEASIEVDAITSSTLRNLVTGAIPAHLSELAWLAPQAPVESTRGYRCRSWS